VCDRLEEGDPGSKLPVLCICYVIRMGLVCVGLDSQPRTRGRRWMRLRHVVLVEEPICMICRRAASVEVDHIRPITRGGTDERDNLQGACKECHEEKTRKDFGLKAKPQRIGTDGYPIKT